MRRVLLSPRWLALHVLLVVSVVGMSMLGVWQWHRGEQGSIRSLAYALQWWMFAGFAIFMWWKMMRAELHPPEVRYAPERAGPDGAEALVVASAVDDEPEDEELAEYNRYLAWLNARAEGQRR